MGFKKLRRDTPDLLKASYLPQNQAIDLMKKKGYTYDKDLSSMQSKVFVNKKGVPVIAQRGSIRLSDWGEDGLILLGLGDLGFRQNNAKKLNYNVEKKYGVPADAVGHSLAGRLIENSGAHGNIITYNKAIGLGDIGKTFKKNQLDIRTKKDIVSGLSGTQKHNVEIINQKKHNNSPIIEIINAHDANNLIPEKKPIKKIFV